jgi:hypothetical protein
LIELASLLAL